MCSLYSLDALASGPLEKAFIHLSQQTNAAKRVHAAETLGCIGRSLQQLQDRLEGEGINISSLEKITAKYNNSATTPQQNQ